jgi:hypothetical protein
MTGAGAGGVLVIKPVGPVVGERDRGVGAGLAREHVAVGVLAEGLGAAAAGIGGEKIDPNFLWP